MDLAPAPDSRQPPASGLTTEEADRRRARDGPNVIVPSDPRYRWRRLLGPLADPMVALLLIAAPTYLLGGTAHKTTTKREWCEPTKLWLLEPEARARDNLGCSAMPIQSCYRECPPVA